MQRLRVAMDRAVHRAMVERAEGERGERGGEKEEREGGGGRGGEDEERVGQSRLVGRVRGRDEGGEGEEGGKKRGVYAHSSMDECEVETSLDWIIEMMKDVMEREGARRGGVRKRRTRLVLTPLMRYEGAFTWPPLAIQFSPSDPHLAVVVEHINGIHVLDTRSRNASQHLRLPHVSSHGGCHFISFCKDGLFSDWHGLRCSPSIAFIPVCFICENSMQALECFLLFPYELLPQAGCLLPRNDDALFLLNACL